MNKKTMVRIALMAAVLTLIPTVLFCQTRFEQYIEIDLLRLEESYRLIDQFGQKIWPGWKNDMGIEFRLQYPNLVFVTIGPKDDKAPEGYELVPDRAVRGRKIYVNRKDELPMKIQPPLLGGGKGGQIIKIFLGETRVTADSAATAIRQAKAENDPSFTPPASSEGQILVIFHEFFHGFQSTVMKGFGKRIEEGRNFQVNPEYSTYSEIEGMALLAAYTEKNKARALAAFKDYSVAREIKRTYMSAPAAANEAQETMVEGTANYSNVKAAELIRDKKYKPGMSAKDDPFFYNYEYMSGYIHQNTVRSIEHIMGLTLNTLSKCYTYGVTQCFLLDRFFPKWKKGFFENGRTLDEVTEKYLKLSGEEKKSIAESFKTKYKYAELYAKHTAVIKDHYEIMDIVNSRAGKRYIIDFRKTKDFIIPMPRGRSTSIGVERFFANGIQEFHLGQIVLTTADTPVYQPTSKKNMYSLEWVDIEAKPGEKGHTFTFEKQEGDVYKNVEFKTAGFTLKAPEVQIVEDPEKNELTIVIVRKVAK